MNTNEYFDPEDTVGCPIWDANLAINDANLAINTEFSDRIAQHGVSLVLWRFLRAFSERDGLTQRELSEQEDTHFKNMIKRVHYTITGARNWP